MAAAVAWRSATRMSDEDLVAEARAIEAELDEAAKVDPVTLAHHLDSRYQVRSHLRVIAREMARLAAGDFNRLMINLPPQSGKSHTTVDWGAFWWLVNHPGHHIVIASYGNQLALKRGKAVRRLVRRYGERFGLTIERGSASQTEWALESGGSVRSVGFGASISGHEADILFIDDPHKSRAEADSPRHRENVADSYSADLLSRRSPGAPVILLQTPWHGDDLRGRVLAHEGRVESGGRWRQVVMPALCTDPVTDPLGRAAGEPLPHPKVAEDDKEGALRHWHEARDTNPARDWNSLYQCDPQPAEGALLTTDLLRARRWFGERVPPAAPVKHAVAVDPSGGGRDVAGIVAGWLGDDQRLYLTHDWSGVMKADQWGRKACQLAAETDADRIIYEANYGGDMALSVIRTAWDELAREELARFGGDPRDPTYRREALYHRPAPLITAVHARKGKLLRAEPIAQRWIADHIRTTAWMPELEGEWETWSAIHPDSPGRIDASVHLAWEMLPLPVQAQSSGVAAMVGVDLTSHLMPGQYG